jgi:hypothetical protein
MSVEKKKTLKVSIETWKALQKIKIERGYRSVEDVIIELLKKKAFVLCDRVREAVKLSITM